MILHDHTSTVHPDFLGNKALALYDASQYHLRPPTFSRVSSRSLLRMALHLTLSKPSIQPNNVASILAIAYSERQSPMTSVTNSTSFDNVDPGNTSPIRLLYSCPARASPILEMDMSIPAGYDCRYPNPFSCYAGPSAKLTDKYKSSLCAGLCH